MVKLAVVPVAKNMTILSIYRAGIQVDEAAAVGPYAYPM